MTADHKHSATCTCATVTNKKKAATSKAKTGVVAIPATTLRRSPRVRTVSTGASVVVPRASVGVVATPSTALRRSTRTKTASAPPMQINFRRPVLPKKSTSKILAPTSTLLPIRTPHVKKNRSGGTPYQIYGLPQFGKAMVRRAVLRSPRLKDFSPYKSRVRYAVYKELAKKIEEKLKTMGSSAMIKVSQVRDYAKFERRRLRKQSTD